MKKNPGKKKKKKKKKKIYKKRKNPQKKKKKTDGNRKWKIFAVNMNGCTPRTCRAHGAETSEGFRASTLLKCATGK